MNDAWYRHYLTAARDLGKGASGHHISLFSKQRVPLKASALWQTPANVLDTDRFAKAEQTRDRRATEFPFSAHFQWVQCWAGSGQAERKEPNGPWVVLWSHSWVCSAERGGFCILSVSMCRNKWEELEKHQRRQGCETAREQSVSELRCMDRPAQHLQTVISHLGDSILPGIGVAGSLGRTSWGLSQTV